VGDLLARANWLPAFQVARAGLKVQAVMSFHAAGSNVGDTCRIPLPKCGVLWGPSRVVQGGLQVVAGAWLLRRRAV
jgi:hypothetical protein